MLAAHLLVAILAGSVSVISGAILGHAGWISLGLYIGGGMCGMALLAVTVCLASLPGVRSVMPSKTPRAETA